MEGAFLFEALKLNSPWPQIPWPWYPLPSILFAIHFACYASQGSKSCLYGGTAAIVFHCIGVVAQKNLRLCFIRNLSELLTDGLHILNSVFVPLGRDISQCIEENQVCLR